jgi:hypothetical protein
MPEGDNLLAPTALHRKSPDEPKEVQAMRLVLALVAVAVLSLVATAAFATVPGEFPPPGSEEATVWQYIPETGQWAIAAHENCEAFRFGAEQTLFCNGVYDYDGRRTATDFMTLDVEASVAQYIEARLGRSNITFYVLKPYEIVVVDGQIVQRDKEYAADCIDLGVKSNGDVTVTSAPIANMIGLDGDVIPLRFAVVTTDSPPLKDSVEWAGVGQTLSHLMREDQAHEVNHLKLWTEIHTSKCNSACDYEGALQLYFVLEEQKPWVIDKLGLPPGPVI